MWIELRDELRAIEAEAGLTSFGWPFGAADYQRVQDGQMRARLLAKLRQMLTVARETNEARVNELRFELISHLVAPQPPPIKGPILFGGLSALACGYFVNEVAGQMIGFVCAALVVVILCNLKTDRRWEAACLERDLAEATQERDAYRSIYAEELRKIDAVAEPALSGA